MAIYDLPVSQVKHAAVFTVVTELGVRQLTRSFTPEHGESRGQFRERCEESVADEFKEYTFAWNMVLIPMAPVPDIIECIVDFKQDKRV